MTKDRYFEMCEAMGTDPIEEEIPIDFEDMPIELQESLRLYNNLRDDWDYMNGNYIGKNLTNFRDIFSIYDIPPEDHRLTYEFIIRIDGIRAKSIQDAKPKKPSK